MAAEAIALGASIAAFIQLADRVISVSKNLMDAGADMPMTLKMAHTEASSLKDILSELSKLHETNPASSVATPAALLKATKAPIEKCHASMEELEGELAKLTISPSHMQAGLSKRQKVKQAVRWATGGEDRVKELLANLITEKATLSLALVADVSYVVLCQLPLIAPS